MLKAAVFYSKKLTPNSILGVKTLYKLYHILTKNTRNLNNLPVTNRNILLTINFRRQIDLICYILIYRDNT